ncbi:EKC/KEOPS complex subunit TPRKB [Porphyridium purpureum]|uniref:EKC/KEOPS complex subunit TPRKB n=1 Tax=Porphyridium purpureum TaxID=35688 RepID=A0A5J4YXR4_PORPP|nr:EKC/KEOPS complex subunit TPRKB [Porphyridium purpureum]|eukprot:POR0430..scf209_3
MRRRGSLTAFRFRIGHCSLHYQHRNTVSHGSRACWRGLKTLLETEMGRDPEGCWARMSEPRLERAFEPYVEVVWCQDVTNAADLVGWDGLKGAMVDAQLVVSEFALRLAAMRAFNHVEHNHGGGETKKSGSENVSVYDQLMLELSGRSKGQTRMAASHFGITPASTCVAFVFVGEADAEKGVRMIEQHVMGRRCTADDAFSMSNHERITALYKVMPPELEVGSLEDAVIFRIGARGV